MRALWSRDLRRAASHREAAQSRFRCTSAVLSSSSRRSLWQRHRFKPEPRPKDSPLHGGAVGAETLHRIGTRGRGSPSRLKAHPTAVSANPFLVAAASAPASATALLLGDQIAPPGSWGWRLVLLFAIQLPHVDFLIAFAE